MHFFPSYPRLDVSRVYEIGVSEVRKIRRSTYVLSDSESLKLPGRVGATAGMQVGVVALPRCILNTSC